MANMVMIDLDAIVTVAQSKGKAEAVPVEIAEDMAFRKVVEVWRVKLEEDRPKAAEALKLMGQVSATQTKAVEAMVKALEKDGYDREEDAVAIRRMIVDACEDVGLNLRTVKKILSQGCDVRVRGERSDKGEPRGGKLTKKQLDHLKSWMLAEKLSPAQIAHALKIIRSESK